ncbi:hypothetical protein H5410_055653, partial [Solanum commersonii]
FLDLEPKRDVIKALLSFWNPTNNVFHFSNFEMTPTLEEIAGFTGFGVRLHHQRIIALRGNSSTSFSTLEYLQSQGKIIKQRYGRENRFKKFGRTLNKKGSFETLKEHRCFALW